MYTQETDQLWRTAKGSGHFCIEVNRDSAGQCRAMQGNTELAHITMVFSWRVQFEEEEIKV